MKGLYKKDKELYLFELVPYRKLKWKNLFERRNMLVPRLTFTKKGILALYSLENSYLEDKCLYYKGKEIGILSLTE